MAHYDVVPVRDQQLTRLRRLTKRKVNEATLSEWSHPPYSGHYDGTYVWGRGSSYVYI